MIRRTTLSLLLALSTLALTGCGQGGGGVRGFMDAWVMSGADAAVGLMDSRTSDSAKQVVRSMTLKSWDGKTASLGENTLTVIDNGNQYDVWQYRVDPVVDFGGTFVPVTMVVSVTKDGGKVFAVSADLSHLP